MLLNVIVGSMAAVHWYYNWDGDDGDEDAKTMLTTAEIRKYVCA
jgi:hypothetical protein